jgi:hypothetical protein
MYFNHDKVRIRCIEWVLLLHNNYVFSLKTNKMNTEVAK